MCSNPVTIYNNGSSRVIPCGSCLACRLDKLALWSARCNSELVKARSSFVTLTYDDNHLNYNKSASGSLALLPTLRKSDFQHFLDNLYHKVKKMPFLPKGNSYDYKFFGCGEYGDSFLRPHLHILFFGLDFKDIEKLFNSTWKNGLVKSLPILNGGIRYVVDYMSKNLNGNLAKVQYDDTLRERPFYSCSRGLGFDFFYSHRKEISSTGCVKIGSRVIPVPTYYKNLFTFYSEDTLYSREKLKIDNFNRLKNEGLKLGFKDYNSYIRYLRKANELNIHARLVNKGRAALPSYNDCDSFSDYPLSAGNI